MITEQQKKKIVAVTVLLPAYNEEQAIGVTVRRIKELHPEFEVLVIDDGSTDNTMQVAMDAGANVWPHPYNIGNGAAIKTGLRIAQGEWVLMMDADGQHKPEDIEKLLAKRDRYDMVVGARTMGSETSFHRDLANWFYNGLASYVTRFNVMDLTSGFRLVKKSVAMKFLYLLPNTFSYPSTITMAYLRSGRTVKYIPIHSRKRQGKSKINLIKDGTKFLLIIVKIATLFAPLRIFLPISLSLLGAGCLLYAYTYSVAQRFTNMSALLFSTAVIVFMMGLVSEQISQMRYERVDE